eukprot:gnl/TRDRNA2_/TRDRNA2_174225_c0_seq3.p1 gnl/TRDRNA2_/TRDRNA2_174225_c0~~gnl/TRDRNA2_/TRDRNA2_174225_c0_seq3.p1  ORF type:complete len:194 (-),score=19.14 gnl/TRDRNA2_/TRDRNA2_174225_c0_seq3:119-700(-)
MSHGLTLPIMSVVLVPDKYTWPWPHTAAGSISSHVTMWECLKGLWTLGVHGNDLNCILAIVMITVFVVALSIVSMLALLATALRLHCDKMEPPRSEDGSTRTPSYRLSFEAAKLAGRLAMLDVFIVGTFVFVVASNSFWEAGLQLSLGKGLLFLSCAEILHYTVHHVVSSSASFVDAALAAATSMHKDKMTRD